MEDYLTDYNHSYYMYYFYVDNVGYGPDDEIGETITINNCEPYLTCPDGCVAHVPGEVCMDAYRLQIQRRIEVFLNAFNGFN